MWDKRGGRVVGRVDVLLGFFSKLVEGTDGVREPMLPLDIVPCYGKSTYTHVHTGITETHTGDRGSHTGVSGERVVSWLD